MKNNAGICLVLTQTHSLESGAHLNLGSYALIHQTATSSLEVDQRNQAVAYKDCLKIKTIQNYSNQLSVLSFFSTSFYNYIWWIFHPLIITVLTIDLCKWSMSVVCNNIGCGTQFFPCKTVTLLTCTFCFFAC